MALTGPQKYPGASTAYWYQDDFASTAMESNVGTVHTTEGRTLPSYGGGASAPNFTALPDIPSKRLRWYQHFDFDRSSRALMNQAGGVDTNTANTVQIELVGTCDERHASTWDGKVAGVDYIFWPAAPDWALAELAKFVRWSYDNHGVQMSSTVTWKAYNKGQAGGSYGQNNGVRLTGAQWNAYYGWLGHQHVPENDHGDPGNIDFARVLAYATGTDTPDQGDTMEPFDVWAFKGDGTKDAFWYQRNAGLSVWGFKGTDEPNDAYAFLRGSSAKLDNVLTKLNALAADVDALTVKVDALVTTGLTEAQIAQIAEATADVVAARLAS